MSTGTVQMRRKGAITLPVNLRRKYGLGEGEVFTLIELGNGSFVLSPKPSAVERWGNKVAEVLREEGITLEEMLAGLDEERERYYREHYVRS